MSNFQRIQSIVIGISMLVAAAVLLFIPQDGCFYIMLLLSASLIVRGIKEIIYFFTMSRYMVGGRLILFIGAVLFDLGFFTLSLANESRFFVLVYLLGVHAFTGVVNILRAWEAWRYKSAAWKGNLAQGIVCILTVVLSLIFSRDETMLVYFYSAGLIYDAVVRIYSAFRRTAIVYIQ